MSAVTGILHEFAQNVGLDAPVFNEQRPFALLLASGRRFSIEASDTAVLVSLSEPLAYDAPARILRAWKLAYYARQSDWPVQAALARYDDTDHLLALVRISTQEFTLGRLQQAVDYLSRWLDRLQH